MAPQAMKSSMRPAASTRSRPMRIPRHAELDLRRLADRASARSTCAPRPPMASRRCCVSISRSTIWSPGLRPTGRVFLKSLGTSWRPLVHIEDIAQAYLVLLRAPEAKVHNRAFNVGQHRRKYRISDVAKLVQEIVPDTRIEFAGGRPAETSATTGELRPAAAHAAGTSARIGPSSRGSREVYRRNPVLRSGQRRLRRPTLQPDRLSETAAGRWSG